ncbi:MAG: 2-amino-4-hydroxy-6-hydroxymethyldihydropteridine diphosphokinase [Pseudomonadota bacterium]
MVRVYLGVGSNIDREYHIAAGLDALQTLFGEMVLSSIYDSCSIGFEGSPFLNLVAGVETAFSPGELQQKLRAIEYAYGRSVNATRFSARQLDIDILTHGTLTGCVEGVELPRAEILENAFVLCPLAEVAGSERHPEVGKTYATLWQEYDQASQSLQKVDFVWQGKSL